MSGRSYSAHATRGAGAVAALTEERKVAKYVNLTPEHLFSPITVETMGILGPRTKALLRDLGRRVTKTTGELGGSYHQPRPEAVSGSAAGQLCLSDGHNRWRTTITCRPRMAISAHQQGVYLLAPVCGVYICSYRCFTIHKQCDEGL